MQTASGAVRSPSFTILRGPARLCSYIYNVMAPRIMLAHPTKPPLGQSTPRRNHPIYRYTPPITPPVPATDTRGIAPTID